MAKPTIRYGMGPTPAGPVFVALSEQGICALFLFDTEDPTPGLDRVRAEHPGAMLVEDSRAVEAVLPAVRAFLEGRGGDDLPIDLSRGTEFQREVWAALRQIPRGETRTYGELARAIGKPGAARAVGAACGANPVSLLVPCHRVIRTGGDLGGYYWGLDRKQALLDRERRN